jgi:hypothetical protein
MLRGWPAGPNGGSAEFAASCRVSVPILIAPGRRDHELASSGRRPRPDPRRIGTQHDRFERPAAPRRPAFVRCQSRRRARRASGGPLSSPSDRARRGASGALYPKSASAGHNSRPRGTSERVGSVQCDVDGEVPFGGRPRTRSGPEGSSLKRIRLRAVGLPRRSWRHGYRFRGVFRRRVHGHPSVGDPCMAGSPQLNLGDERAA